MSEGHPASSHLGRHILDGTIRGFLAEALFPLTGIVTAAFLTRRLGTDGYGLLVLAATVASWVDWTIGSLFARATIKLIGEAEDWRPVGATVMRLHLVWGCSAALLLCLVAVPLAALLQEPVLALYLALFALDIPISNVARVHTNILIGIGSFGPRALARASRWIARLVLIVVLVELGLSVTGAILGSIGASLAELAVGRWYVSPSVSRRAAFPARQLWIEAVPLFLFALSVTLHARLDLLALKILGGTSAEAGIYGAAQSLSSGPGLFALSFSPLLLSTLSRALRGGDTWLARDVGRDAMRAVLGLLPFVGVIIGSAPEIVDLVFGPAFSTAAPLLACLSLGALAQVMISVAAVILVASGKSHWAFAMVSPLVPLAIVGHAVLIPRLGPFGASLVTTVSAGAAALAAMTVVYRVWQIRPSLGTVGRSLLLFGMAYAVAVSWPAPGIFLFVKLTVIAVVIFAAFLLLGEFSADERAMLRSVVRRQKVPQHNPGPLQ
jgi:O-antigen/teichoic acid export membrane protein